MGPATAPPEAPPVPPPEAPPVAMAAIDRLAAWVLGRVPRPGPARARQLRAAWVVVSLHLAVRLELSLWFAGWPRYWLVLPVLGFACGLWRPWRRPAAVVLAGIQLVRFGLAYPDVSNHYLIECLAIVAFAAVDLAREDEQDLCLQMLCWLAVAALLASGLQKLLHGGYFQGQYLAYMVANADRFRRFLGPLVPAADLAHLRGLAGAIDRLQFRGGHLVGALPGPYRVHSLWFVAVSNAVWLGELAIPLGLLWQRTRRVALVLALVLLAGILGASNELFFDTLFANLLLLFARSDLGWKLLPLSLASYAYYLLVAFGALPGSFVW